MYCLTKTKRFVIMLLVTMIARFGYCKDVSNKAKAYFSIYDLSEISYDEVETVNDIEDGEMVVADSFQEVMITPRPDVNFLEEMRQLLVKKNELVREYDLLATIQQNEAELAKAKMRLTVENEIYSKAYSPVEISWKKQEKINSRFDELSRQTAADQNVILKNFNLELGQILASVNSVISNYCAENFIIDTEIFFGDFDNASKAWAFVFTAPNPYFRSATYHLCLTPDALVENYNRLSPIIEKGNVAGKMMYKATADGDGFDTDFSIIAKKIVLYDKQTGDVLANVVMDELIENFAYDEIAGILK